MSTHRILPSRFLGSDLCVCVVWHGVARSAFSFLGSDGVWVWYGVVWCATVQCVLRVGGGCTQAPLVSGQWRPASLRWRCCWVPWSLSWALCSPYRLCPVPAILLPERLPLPTAGPGGEESPGPHCGWVAWPGRRGDKHWPSLSPQTLPRICHGDQVPVRTWQDLPHAKPGLAGLIPVAFCNSLWIPLQLTKARPAVCQALEAERL